MNRAYFISVLAMILVIPIAGSFAEHIARNSPLTVDLFGKWFIFSAAGLRLLIAGVRQSINPAFTAKEIFHVNHPDSLPIVRELGFANLCFGLVGVISLFNAEWRIVSAFASGLFYGLAGLLHVLKKPVSANETFALWTDLLVFGVLSAYFITTL